MANQMPIYSQVVPKSQYRGKNSKSSRSQMGTREFDPLNFNNGGNFLSPTTEKEKGDRGEKERKERRERSRDEASRARRSQNRNEASEIKVEAYLRQNQVNMRQQQHRHSAVRQAEHRVNLRSLQLNDVVPTRGHDRTPTERHKGFPGDKDGTREHRRERDKDRDRDRENYDADGTPLSPVTGRHESSRPVRKSSSSHRVTETSISTDKRKFFCREWAFQKIAHCLEQRAVSNTAGALILGDAGSGKTALCQELSSPSAGPAARQQRALNRRLLARHFLQSNNENSLRPSEFVRSLAMQILSHSSRRARNDSSPRETSSDRRNSDDDRDNCLMNRFHGLDDDGEESSKPLLADSEDQRTDEEEGGSGRRARTIERIHERSAYQDSMPLAPEIMPRTTPKPSNPFVVDNEQELRLYENHENLFLRNISHNQSKEARLLRQSSEPTASKPNSNIDLDKPKSECSPPKSRIPVANFRYPNKSELRPENSPQKTKPEKPEELPEYQNVMAEQETTVDEMVENKRSEEEIPPPIPTLPLSARTTISDAYYDKVLSDSEIQRALLPQHLDADVDLCFKRAILYPLLEITPPKQTLMLVVDAVDEGFTGNEDREGTEPATTVATLLARHQHLLPQWLLLVCTARRHARPCYGMFTGYRKIMLDELQRAHVSADVQRYVLARLDTEPRLRSRVSSDATAAAAAAAALDNLRIKSDGCLLYLEKVLDGVADGFIALREIREIPGTLNGLYLWLAQRLFHGRRFTKVRPLLDVLLAARCGVTEEMLYKCLLTKEYSVTREDFNRRLHLLRRILVMDRSTGYLSIFHHSFASWLLDVKHCTRRYLCCHLDGHAQLAMYYTLDARRLTSLEIHNYVYHMTTLEQHMATLKKGKTSDAEEVMDLHTLVLLWVLDSGCDVETALEGNSAVKQLKANDLDEKVEETLDKTSEEPETEARDATSDTTTLEAIMPELVSGHETGRWPRDKRVYRTLMELSRDSHAPLLPSDDPEHTEDKAETPVEEPEVPEVVEPGLVHELANKGDDDALAALLKRHQSLVEATDATGGTALHSAARGGRASTALCLLKAGAEPSRPDADGWTPLRAAAWAGHAEVVEVLLEYGCDVDCVDADNRTALRAAAWSGHESVVAKLLTAGADPDKADAEGRTPLIAAAYMGHADIVRALLDAGADLDHADEDGRTALSVASLCATGEACAAILLERGASVSKADRDKATPLLVAAFEGHTEICELLLEAEADIEAADAAGRTALWAAAAAGHAHTTRLLLYWGACVDNMDNEGRTVLSTAAAQGDIIVYYTVIPPACCSTGGHASTTWTTRAAPCSALRPRKVTLLYTIR
ncbi:hypothetical protein evm_009717 [Chilo suppressalis]|nr:hypothetical protein evm_009717 [Chilo suppressalis]